MCNWLITVIFYFIIAIRWKIQFIIKRKSNLIVWSKTGVFYYSWFFFWWNMINVSPIRTIATKINVTPKGVPLPISKLHSILAVENLLAHNNKSQICYCVQISLQSAAVNCSFSDNLTHLGGYHLFCWPTYVSSVFSFATLCSTPNNCTGHTYTHTHIYNNYTYI